MEVQSIGRKNSVCVALFTQPANLAAAAAGYAVTRISGHR